jgi:hypothetical protein
MTGENPSSQPNPGPQVYQIRVQGQLDERWSGWFEGLAIHLESEDPLITALTGPVVDQASLRGVLIRIWNLNLSLISVNRVEAGSLLSTCTPDRDQAEDC